LNTLLLLVAVGVDLALLPVIADLAVVVEQVDSVQVRALL
jgi:hypothetical protein